MARVCTLAWSTSSQSSSPLRLSPADHLSFVSSQAALYAPPSLPQGRRRRGVSIAGMKAQVSEPPVDGQDQVRHLNLVPETVSAGVGALAGNEL